MLLTIWSAVADQHSQGSGVVFVWEAHCGSADLKAEWGGSAFGFFPCFLAAEGSEVEVVVSVVEFFDASSERGIRVEYVVVDTEERADARQF